MKGRLGLFLVVTMIGVFVVYPLTSLAARDGGYDVTSSLWAKAVLQVPGSPVTLIWREVGSDITPSGDKVVSGYFYADPGDFAYGSEFNPEVFVKIYIAKSGWCNIAFNHVTVDNVSISSAHNYAGMANQTGTASLNSRLVENQYDGVQIDDVAVSGKIPDTGQTTSYTSTFGEDSDYTINPPSYTKLDDSGNALSESATSWAMVKDNVTGLIWENKTDDGGIHDKDNTYTWPNTNVFIAKLNNDRFGGHSDWRLPTVKELSTLVHADKPFPGLTINMAYFQNMMSSGYWSSTTSASYSSGTAWNVNFDYGYVGFYGKSSNLYVRAVRGGQSGLFGDSVISGRMVNNGNGTVTDTATGLMWQKGETGQMYWTSSLSYCENLQLAGYNDWRLPSRNELQSLVDYSKYNPAIDTVAFPGAMSSNYWSSTALASNSDHTWGVDFDNGSVFYGDKSINLYVRAVRGGFDVTVP